MAILLEVGVPLHGLVSAVFPQVLLAFPPVGLGSVKVLNCALPFSHQIVKLFVRRRVERPFIENYIISQSSVFVIDLLTPNKLCE